MQMKKISIIVTLLFAALLCACAPQIHTQNPTEGSTEPPQPVWQPITKLECIQPSSAPVVLPAQEGLLACWMDFSAAPVTHLRRVDIAADEVTAAADFDGCLDLFAENFSDGGYVLRDGANEQWVLLNADLQEQTRFAAKSMDGFFSHNRSRFYFVEGGRLFCTEIGSGATAPVETGYDLHFSHIAAFHPTQEQIALRVDVSPFSYEDGTAIFDLDSGSFLFLEDGMYTVTFGDDGIRLLCYEEQAQGYSMTFTAGEQTAKIAPADLAQKTGLIAVSGSPYLAGFDNGTELYRLNDTVTVCSLRENGLSDMLTEYAWLPEDGLLVGSVWQETGAELYLICPELLPFDKEVPAEPVQPLGVDAGVETRYWEAMNGGMLPDYMMELRSRADALEQTYGITVLLSSQAAALAEQSSFELVLTDTMPQEEELAATGHFLDALQECLSCYPKDFFRQFQNVHGEGGLCFFPSAHIVSDNGAIGVCYECLAWQGITLDATRDRKSVV